LGYFGILIDVKVVIVIDEVVTKGLTENNPRRQHEEETNARDQPVRMAFMAPLPILGWMRTNRHQYFLDLALRCAHQGTCLRRNFGAIIVDEYNTIVSTGYTGAPRKQMDCTELKTCWRKRRTGLYWRRCFWNISRHNDGSAAKRVTPGPLKSRTLYR
jgi:deoxycytidylate deaminase